MSKKTLYLVRHAKSSWKDNTLPDRQRPLNKRGHRNAAEMAQRVADRKIRPDLLVSSPATRAQSTAQYFAREMDYPEFDIQIDERLYFCGVKGGLNTLKSLNEEIDSVMLVGHNPDISELVNYLTHSELEPFTTCTVAKIKLKLSSWRDIANAEAELKFLDAPNLPLQGSKLNLVAV